MVLSEYTEARLLEKERVFWSGGRLWPSTARWVRAVFIASAVTLSTDERETISVSSDASPGLESRSLAGVLVWILGFEVRVEDTAALWDLTAPDTEGVGDFGLTEEYLLMISSMVGFTRGNSMSAVS